jgi:hypothetical protein
MSLAERYARPLLNPLLSSILFSAVFISAHAGTLTVGECTPIPCFYSFSGEITNADVSRFQSIQEGPTAVPVYLNSPGGDIGAAIKIANILDAKRAMVIIKKGAVCYSACVVALAGGVIRLPHGTVGIHRMYSVDLEGTYSEKEKGFASIEYDVKKIFRRSGIPESFWTKIIDVPADSLHKLTDKELNQSNLHGSTPAYNDYMDGQVAKGLGISKQELLSRRRTAFSVCSKIPATQNKWLECMEKINGY